MSKTLAVLALTLPAANAAYTWTKGTKMCAGIKVPCTDKATCSATAVGPCPDGEKPTAYLESQLEGLAFVNSKKYLDAKTGKVSSDAKTYKIIDATGPGFRDYKGEIKPAGGGKFAFTMAGNVFGDTNTAGGYAGLVSYLNTGTTTLETNTVDVFGASTGDVPTDRSAGSGRSFLQPPNTTKANALTTFFFFSCFCSFFLVLLSFSTDWSDSDKGAPHGPYRACISEIGADKTCGAKRSIKADE